MTAAQPLDAVAVLVTAVDYHWPERFRVRGREFVMVPGGPASFYEDAATFRVWNASGKETDVRVRRSDRVEVLSYS